MRLIIWLVVKLLEVSSLTMRDRTILTNAVLDKLYALPFRDILRFSEEGSILINDERIDYDKALLLRESAKAALNNPLRKIVRDQVAYKAITIGVHKLETPEQAIFSKSAIWWGQAEDEIYRQLAQ